jgi:hypothetical protein
LTTALHRISKTGKQAKIDLIFVHGIGGGPKTTWTDDPAAESWLDWVDADQPDFNVYTAEYESAASEWLGPASMSIYDRANIGRALAAIKGDEGYASEGYYYPFFRNYAVTLAKSVGKISERITKNGALIFFVRDTVRKDILFPTGLLIARVMEDQGFALVDKERHIVMRRPGPAAS